VGSPGILNISPQLSKGKVKGNFTSAFNYILTVYCPKKKKP
jgi:hypothetical protein